MYVSKKIPEHEREKTSVGLDRRVGGPAKQDRPPSPPKFEADMKDFEELVEFAKKTIEDVFATTKKVGWETPYIIMPEHPKKSVPFVSWHGIVLLV